MARKQMPELSDTGRRYLDDTVRARLASPGIERYRPPRRRGGRALAVAVAALAALVALFFAFAHR
jgi:ferric-dicitrate binding protein FerR (iron transport regulator)